MNIPLSLKTTLNNNTIIQNHKGKAKAYQVKQVLLAIERLEVDNDFKK